MYLIISTLRKSFSFTPAPQAFTEKLRRFQLFPGFARIFGVFLEETAWTICKNNTLSI